MSAIQTDAPAAPRILIVDDEDIIRELLAEFLGDLGYSVSLAPHAEEGLRQAEREVFDLALVDFGLPGMNGIEFCRQLWARGYPTRLVLMTGMGSMDEAEQSPYISQTVGKPFDLFSILSAVESLVGPARR